MKKYCIYGAGGFGREVAFLIQDILGNQKDVKDEAVFMIDDAYYQTETINEIKVIKRSAFEADKYKVVVAVADPLTRQRMADELPKEVEFATLIHNNVIKSKWVEIGEGSIITAGCILTSNIIIGKHSHLNLNTTIGHDCIIEDYFTTAPAVNVSGNCIFGKRVYLGTNAAIREKVTICDDVTIGMGAVVLRNIELPGIYVGNPIKKLK
jgi:sugar O-acyltransferase (sialic acid O-acetyltransferase NeuD family)